MQNNPQGLRLPVDPHEPHPWAFNKDLPNVVPNIPPVQCAQGLQPYLQLLVGMSLLEAQNHAGRNPLRTFYFNMLTNNNFQNQDYLELMQSVAEVADYLVSVKHLGITQAIQEAA